MTAVQNVLIVGAGMAGMTLGIALKRAGIACDIVEIRPNLTEPGTGISLQGPALRALQAVGMADETQSVNRVRDQTLKQPHDLNGFDYNAPAELYPSRIKKGRGRITYKRFDTAAKALQFAIEEIPAAVLLGAYLEVDEARFGVAEIRTLYDSPAYPLKRAAAAN